MVYHPPGSVTPAPAASSNNPPAYTPSYSNNNNNHASGSSSYGYGSAPAPANYASSGGVGYGASNPSSGYGSSGSNYNSNQSSATSSYNPKPDFSQALDVPPPAQTTTTPSYPSQPHQTYSGGATQTQSYAPTQSYGGGASNYGRQPLAPSYGASGNNTFRAPNDYANTMMSPSTGNSSVYTAGPSGGLISEGNPTKCHKVDYEIKGHEMQLVEIELDPSETVIAEAGAMMFIDDGIDFKTKFGDGSEPKQTFWKKLMSAGGRLLTGESLFITHFTNRGQGKARVAFAAPFPGSIVPINMASFGNQIICQKDAFLCAAFGTSIKLHFNKKLGSGLVGGEGFILQKLQGDGMAFIHAGGCIIKRELRGERIRLDTGCLVAFTEGINFDVQMAPGLKTMFFGGEGLFLATLQGTGTVWLQSLPFSRMADRVIQHAPSIGGRRQGEGSALTGRLGDAIDGDGMGMAGLIGRF